MKRKHDSTLNNHTSRQNSGRAPAQKKLKKIIRPQKIDGVDLRLVLDRAVLLDPPSFGSLPPSERYYRIVWWIEPGGKEHTSVATQGLPNPEWNNKWTVNLGANPPVEALFVNVEVLRYNSKKNRCDPGTSDNPSIGEVIRARIPFPKTLDEKVKGRYELVKHDGAGNIMPAGDIILSMTLETYFFTSKAAGNISRPRIL
ncbi:hypothetical protein M0R45_037503 [Rubus argutus]|uniref:C2 domain-containing protein n=1 Tax=Rubus argutus TaxID=59490 RepID=A0AAW1VZ89_RUBAR